MLSLWANWLVTKFGLNSLKRYLWPVLYVVVFANMENKTVNISHSVRIIFFLRNLKIFECLNLTNVRERPIVNKIWIPITTVLMCFVFEWLQPDRPRVR